MATAQPSRNELETLVDEIEEMPDHDALMDEIDGMETVEAKDAKAGVAGSAMKYQVTDDCLQPGAVQDTDRGPSVALVAIDENPHCQSSPAARSPDPLFSDNTRPESPERPESPDPLERKKPPPEFAEWAMCCIHKDHAVRRTLKTILIHPRFDQVSLTVIGLNCITLALFDPLDPDCKRDKCKVVSGFEFCWTIFFTAEFFFKWLVMGFFGKGGYWEDSWNRLDFIIVVFGAFDFMPSGVEIPGTSALRTLRAIRPLRALNKFPSLRILVNLLCETLPQMASVGMLCFFIFFVFGILAVQLWMGLFRQRCFIPGGTDSQFFNPEDPYICTITDNQQSGMNKCAPDPTVWEGDDSGFPLANFTTCEMRGPNPHYGAIHFDHIFAAWVSIFQCITLEAWVDIMYMTQDGYGFGACVYFVLLIIAGAWFAVNLTLVVISAQFGSTKNDQLEEMTAQINLERQIRERAEKAARRQRKKGWIQKLRERFGCAPPPVETEETIARHALVINIEQLEVDLKRTKNPDQKAIIQKKIDLDDLALVIMDSLKEDNDGGAASNLFTLIDKEDTGEVEISEFKTHLTDKFKQPVEEVDSLLSKMDANHDGSLTRKEFVSGYIKWSDAQRIAPVRLRLKLRRVVLSDDFGNIIMGCIGVNVIFMAIEHYPQPEALEKIVEYANLFFCLVFAFEMCLKLIAKGILAYLSDGFDVFDGTIVIVSLVELGMGGGGLSVLRTFRLVRVFRLISFLPTLQKQISVMIQTLGEVGSFLLILGLFIFIISIVGMFIFGGQFTWNGDGDHCDVKTQYVPTWAWVDSCEPDRKNFDNMAWALITVFQVLTQEDWNAAMYNGVRALGFPSCIYFIFLIVFGNYILFNLFVAILIDGFAEGGDEEEDEEGEDEDEVGKAKEQESIIDKPDCHDETDGKMDTGVTPTKDPETKPQVGVGAGSGTVEGAGVGCGQGAIAINVNPTVRARRPTRTRVIDVVMPGVVPPNNELVGRWKWRDNGDEIEDCYKRHTTGPWRLSATGSGSGSGVGTEAGEGGTIKQDELIQASSDDAVTTYNKGDDDSGVAAQPGMELPAAKPEDTVAQPVPHQPKASCMPCCQSDNSLFCFGPTNACRIKCQEWVDDKTENGKILDKIIMACIGVNSITLAMERPAMGDAEREVVDAFGHFFTFMFSVEFIMKVISWNFLFGPKDVVRKFKGPARYWDDGWNKLDGTLVMISWLDLLMSVLPGADGGALLGLLKICRILRALRPLRAVNKLPGLKLVVNCLLASLQPIGTTLIIVFTIFFIFGILGTQLFMGRMATCTGADGIPETANITTIVTKQQCDLLNGHALVGGAGLEWKTNYYNFDNLGQSLLTLFVLSSIDGWVDIMYAGIDGVAMCKEDAQDKCAEFPEYPNADFPTATQEWPIVYEPVVNNSEIMSIFFIAFLLLGGFLILNMFVGVILENFNQAQSAEEDKRAAQIASGEIVEEPPKEPVPDVLEGDFYLTYGATRRKIYEYVHSETFNSITAAVIAANVTIMASEHYDPPRWFADFIKAQNYAFSVIFIMEMIVKLLAYGHLYFCNNWCRFDFLLVIVSIFDVIVDIVGADLPINPTILRILRVMRIARVLRLMKGQWAIDLRKLLSTVISSLAQAGNLGLLLFLLYFIFACLGTELFGRMACTVANGCEGMSDKANFENFFMSLLVLFRLSTGDNWNGMLKDALRVEPTNAPCDFALSCVGDNCCNGCDSRLTCEENCCAGTGQGMSCMYYTLFILAAQFVMLNLVVAVLMKELTAAEEADKQLQEEQAAKQASDGSSTTIQILDLDAERAKDDAHKRKSLDETMTDGAKYWKRRLSQAHRPDSVMYDFKEKTPNAVVHDTVAVKENDLPNAMPPTDTNGFSGDNNDLPERPPTRSAWHSNDGSLPL